MAFTIHIEGLEEFIKMSKEVPSLDIAKPDIALGILKAHSVIEQEIASNYFVPRELSTVFLGNKVTGVDNLLEAGLSYKEKKIPLSEYPHVEKLITENIENAIPFQRNNGKTGYLPVNKARKVTSKVRRKGTFSGSRFNTKYGKFLTVINGTEQIVTRKEKETWSQIPSGLDEHNHPIGGIRTPIKTLYGPNLATLAAKMWNENPKVQVAVDKITETIINKLKDFYK